MRTTTGENSDLRTRDAILGVAVVGCGLLATLMHWGWFPGQGAPPLGLTIAIAFLAAAVVAVVLRSWLSWSNLRSARRETDACFRDLDRALTRTRRQAPAGDTQAADTPRDRQQIASPGKRVAMTPHGVNLELAWRRSGSVIIFDDPLELMRREWLRDQQVLEAMRDNDAFLVVWRRKFGPDAPDPRQVMQMLERLLRK